jgi:hypothetical protein
MGDRLDDVIWFLVERHLLPMLAIVERLGDERANERPLVPGGNSPYQIVWHCCGMVEWWTREVMLGTNVGRDRDGEFDATGSLAVLRDRVGAVVAQLREDLKRISWDEAPAGVPSAHYLETPVAQSGFGVLMHVFEELAQHHGQLELTRDLLLAG